MYLQRLVLGSAFHYTGISPICKVRAMEDGWSMHEERGEEGLTQSGIGVSEQVQVNYMIHLFIAACVRPPLWQKAQCH